MRAPIPLLLRFLLILAVSAFAIDRVVAYAARKGVEASPNRFSQLYFGQMSADLIILGNSRADSHLDPGWIEVETGLRTVNLGLGGNHMALSAVLFEDYLERHPAPRFAIVEVSSATENLDDLGDFIPFSYASPRLAALSRQIVPNIYFGAQALNTLYFNNDMFFRVLKDLIQPPGGSRLLGHTMAPDLWEKVLPIKPMPEANRAALRRIGELARTHGITLIPVVAPYGVRPRNIQGLDTMVADAEAALAPWPVRNYATAVQDPSKFANPTHLNRAGSIDWMRQLFVTDAATAWD
ncbi:MAG: hypothetical protein AAGJ28_00870 [Pseudomonadota bacterium]